MIIAYFTHPNIKPIEIDAANSELLNKAVWIDLFFPSKEEENLVEQYLQLEIPTKEEMSEIELSSRLYKENGALIMTAMMIAHSESPDPEIDAVTFIFTQKQLITIRYIEPQSFKQFIARIRKIEEEQRDAAHYFVELLDATIDRLADVLELIGHRLEDYSKIIFHNEKKHHENKIDYNKLLRELGKNGELNSKARDSLVTFSRLVAFFGQKSNIKSDNTIQLLLTSIIDDIKSLSDHVNFLSSKINFLLDATLGMINIEQNRIIKIFSIAAVIFLPPTLIASIYGMNFKNIPELDWEWGYPIAIFLIILAAWLPYKYFKIRKWL